MAAEEMMLLRLGGVGTVAAPQALFAVEHITVEKVLGHGKPQASG